MVHRVIEGGDHFFTHKGPAPAARAALDLMAEQLRAAFSAKA